MRSPGHPATLQLGANPIGIGGFDLAGTSAPASIVDHTAAYPRIAISKDGRRLFIADPGGSAVWVADSNGQMPSTAVKLGEAAPLDIVISPDGKRLYVTEHREVRLVDTSSSRCTVRA